MSLAVDLKRIEDALMQAQKIALRYTPGNVESSFKSGDDPVTRADTELDTLLKKLLLRPGEGWLSEETADNPERLNYRRVWIVDPLDGTREFVEGIPEWCISIGLAIEGKAVAGGICNPATGQIFLGSIDSGVTLNGKFVSPTETSSLASARILASRSEVKRGQWKCFEGRGFTIVPSGSVAYKLACVAAGLADGTFTLVPKHEWDIAAGVALIQSAGGIAQITDGSAPLFNQPDPLIPGLIAAGTELFHLLTATTRQ
ncbi:MAG: 3'(2'),5'-bisphosphate nucleotidase CysQ [Phycisphaerae bacterium]|nr:3'(2'),5'-bisphosphate nucleotidase CysQ [Phycisphaerae bacterium]